MTANNYIYFYPQHQKIYFDELPHFKNDSNQDIITLAQKWQQGDAQFSFKTSGSTGTPKNIVLHRDQIIGSIQHISKQIDYRPGQNCLLCLDVKHIGGAMVLFRALHTGMNIYVCPPQSKEIDFFLNEGIELSHASFVPLQMQKLLPSYKKQLENIQTILLGGSTVPEKIRNIIYNFTNIVYHTYGMTETCSNIAIRKLSQKSEEKYYTVFDGIQLATDSNSCLKICGDITQNEWLQTNDTVLLHPPHQLEFLGRADFVINSGGLKTHPEILEGKLAAVIPDKNYIISSKPDELLGEKIVLVIEGNEDSIINFDHLNSYEKPKEIIYIPELHKTEGGKIDRRKIKAVLEKS